MLFVVVWGWICYFMLIYFYQKLDMLFYVNIFLSKNCMYDYENDCHSPSTSLAICKNCFYE